MFSIEMEIQGFLIINQSGRSNDLPRRGKSKEAETSSQISTHFSVVQNGRDYKQK